MSLINSESSRHTEKVHLSSGLEEPKMHSVIFEAEKLETHIYLRV